MKVKLRSFCNKKGFEGNRGDTVDFSKDPELGKRICDGNGGFPVDTKGKHAPDLLVASPSTPAADPKGSKSSDK